MSLTQPPDLSPHMAEAYPDQDDASEFPSPPASDSASNRPWASGRVLSQAQRERKREVDRLSKAKRRRDQSESQDTVTALKRQVEQLSLKVKSLEWEDVQRQRQFGQRDMPYQATTRQPLDQTHADDFATRSYHFAQDQLSASNVQDSASSSDVTGGYYHSTLTHVQDVPHSSAIPDQYTSISTQNLYEVSGAATEDTIKPKASSTAPFLPAELAAINAQSTPGPTWATIKDIFNSIVSEASSGITPATRPLIVTDTILTQDALIRGVLHGWHTVLCNPADQGQPHASTGTIRCPILIAVARTDSLLFSFAPLSTRLISLRMIHLMLLYLTSCVPVTQLPAWYRPRPSQMRISHESVVDLIPWPGVRERAVFDPELVKPNHLWRSIIALFRFNWPYSQELAVTEVSHVESNLLPGDADSSMSGAAASSNSGTRYIFTDAYIAQMWDIRMWNLEMEFFKDFPEVFDDVVPRSFVAPMYIQPTGTATGLITSSNTSARALALVGASSYDIGLQQHQQQQQHHGYSHRQQIRAARRTKQKRRITSPATSLVSVEELTPPASRNETSPSR